MNVEALWQRYSASWSNPDDGTRAAELEACLADDVTYCDPNGLIAGRTGLSAYMAGYQQQTPAGAHFVIRSFVHHHDRSLAHWAFVDVQDREIYTGSSFGLLAEDGRLRTISGFFYPSAAG